MESLLAHRQLRCTGHVCRMSDERLPKQILYGELHSRRRKAGGQRKRYKDDLKQTLHKCDIQPDQLELLVVDRRGWRNVCVRGLAYCEKRGERLKEAARARRHKRTLQPPATDDQYECHLCGRRCLSRIGLLSHSRAHERRQQAVIFEVERQP